jgi:carbonic anhydrase/acetyltransferase-like protein (isoleucine patch superfamily)
MSGGNVNVGVSVMVAVGTGVGLAVGDGVRVGAGVLVGAKVGVGTGVAVGARVTVGVGLGGEVGIGVKVGVRAGKGSILTLAVTLLLPLLGSVSLPATLPATDKFPASEVSSIREMDTTTSSSLATAPKRQETAPSEISHVPWSGRADTTLMPGGSNSVSTTAVALEGPELATVSS